MFMERSPLFYPFFPWKWKEVWKKDFTLVNYIKYCKSIFYLLYNNNIYIYILLFLYLIPFFHTPPCVFLIFGFSIYFFSFFLFTPLELMEKRKKDCILLENNGLRPNLFSIFFPSYGKKGGV